MGTPCRHARSESSPSRLVRARAGYTGAPPPRRLAESQSACRPAGQARFRLGRPGPNCDSYATLRSVTVGSSSDGPARGGPRGPGRVGAVQVDPGRLTAADSAYAPARVCTPTFATKIVVDSVRAASEQALFLSRHGGLISKVFKFVARPLRRYRRAAVQHGAVFASMADSDSDPRHRTRVGCRHNKLFRAG